MAAHTLCWLAVLGCWLFGNANAEVPSYFSAESYDFQLFLGKNNHTFSGVATIVLKTNNDADTRSKDLMLSGSGLIPSLARIEYANKRQVLVPSNEIKIMSDTITIPGKEFLLKNSTYKITIGYTGRENSEGGVFSSTYSNSTYYGTKVYPIYSKRVFPCLDLPGNHATISLAVTVPKAANQPVPVVISGLSSVLNNATETSVTYYFVSQAAIPVNSLFFTAGPYKQATAVAIPTGMEQVSGTIANALAISEVTDLLQKTKVLFPNVKLSAVVVPGLGSDSESGLGLAAFSVEQALEVTSMQRKRTQAVHILRGIYRSLFVSLLTPKTWEDIWIPESISLYLASKTYTQIPGLEVWKDMNLDVVISALETAWSPDSSPVQKNFTDPSQVVEYLQGPAVNKGASILAMLASALPEGMDIEVINQLCIDYFGDQISSMEFATSFADYTGLTNFPDNKTLAEVLDPWLKKPGYPAIMVSRKETDILAGESVYGNKDENVEWIVPVNYRLLTASQNKLGANEDELKWLTPSKNADFKLAEKVSNRTTISLNSRGTGLYRTWYDDKDIELLGEVLTYDGDMLDARSRATLLNDLFAFIKTRDLKYSVVLGMLQYLRNENNLEPWTVALRGLEELRRLIYFKDNETLEQFNSLAGDYLRHPYLKMPIASALMEDNPVKRILTSKVARWLCTYDDFTCNMEANDAYDNYILKGKESSIRNKDIIPVLYCSKLMELSSKDFKTFLAKYNDASTAEERRNVLSYLACPQDNSTINWYLTTIMSNSSPFLADDIVVAFEELAARLEHLDLCFSFLNSNFGTLHKKLTDEHKAKLIAVLGNFGSSDNHLNMLKNFPASNSSLIKNALEKAVNSVGDRQKFLNDNFSDIQLGLFGFDPSNTTSPSPSPPNPTPPNPSPPNPSPTLPTPKPTDSASSTAVFAALIPMAVLALLAVH